MEEELLNVINFVRQEQERSASYIEMPRNNRADSFLSNMTNLDSALGFKGQKSDKGQRKSKSPTMVVRKSSTRTNTTRTRDPEVRTEDNESEKTISPAKAKGGRVL